MAFTDPPYNVNYTGCGSSIDKKFKRREIKNDNLDQNVFNNFLDQVTKRLLENCNGGIYICMSYRYIGELKAAFQKNGGKFSTFIIWIKNTFVMGRGDYQSLYEPILYGWPAKEKRYFAPARNIANAWEDLAKIKTEEKNGKFIISFQGFKVEIEGQVTGGRVIRRSQKTDIWRFDKPTRNDIHPTMKPVAMVSEAIKNSSKKGQIVFDPFMGSGSTLIAAEKMERAAYGIDLDPEYIDMAVQRYAEYCKYNNRPTEIYRNGKIWAL